MIRNSQAHGLNGRREFVLHCTGNLWHLYRCDGAGKNPAKVDHPDLPSYTSGGALRVVLSEGYRDFGVTVVEA